MNKKLNIILLLGAIYFFIVSLLHFTGIKIPMFFIYYDVDSTIYQDRIISVLSFIFAVFLYAGYKINSIELVKYILIAGFVGITGLAINNYITNISFKTNTIYWLEIGLLFIYVSSVAFFYSKSNIK